MKTDKTEEKNRKASEKFFLFRRETEEMSATQKTVYIVWNVLCLLLSSFVLCIASLMLAYGPYPAEIFSGFFEQPLILLLNFLPIFLLQLLLYAAIGRQWIAYLITALIFTVASISNYYKLTLRNDPVVFSDLSAMFTALDFADHYEMEIGRRVLLAAFCVPVGTVILFFLARGKANWKVRIALGLLALAPLYPLWKFVYSQKSVFKSPEMTNSEAIYQWSDTQQMVSRGFVYSFIYSATKVFEPAPEGYSEAAVKQTMSAFEDADIPEEKKVNIIAIQMEAFCDLETVGITGIDEEAYRYYRSLRESSYSGTLITNIFAGGTIDTERCFVTGSSVLHYYGNNTPSYAWYLRSQGYQTTGNHPCTWEFYNRRSINEYLGFETYYYMENCYAPLTEYKTADDTVLFPVLLEKYNAAKKNGPVFEFTVTYQGHGPYNTELLGRGESYWDGTGYSEEAYYAVNNYLSSVKHTGDELQHFIEALAADDTPVVVILFGDHKPWMGNDASIYHELGVSFDLSCEEGIRNYYGTEYIIWANDAAKQVTGFDYTGEAPTVSSGYLMNILFNTLGWKGPAYMQYTEQLRQCLPVVTSTNIVYDTNGLVTELTPEQKQLLNELQAVQYYRHRHFGEIS